LAVRGSRWDWSNPFVLGAGAHPSNASVQTKDATNVVGIWNKVVSDTKVQEVRIGYNNFDWTNSPLLGLANTIEYDITSALTIGRPYNYPQLFHQNNFESRYDLNWHRDTHDFKIGGEFLFVKNTGTWYIQQVGDEVHGDRRHAHSADVKDFGDGPAGGRLTRKVPGGTPTALPPPGQPNASAVPGDHRFRFDDDERRSPPGPETGQPDPEPTVHLRGPNRRGRVRCSTSSWCRNASTSSWSAACERANPRSVRRSEGSTDIIAEKRIHGRPQHRLPQ
jgi:hypothetical protein